VPSSRIWWKEAIGYEIFPKSFYDANGDGVGDLKGIILKLPYIASLGVNLIWICPFYQSPMDDSGYDVSDFYQVDSSFGTNQDFKELLKFAHGLGIKVIIDLVLNHTSDEHPWFIESRKNKYSKYHQYYIWKDARKNGQGERIPPTNWQGYFDDSSWAYDEEAGQYYLKIFSKKMPDLNWEHEPLRKEMYQVAKHWLDLGADGFRMDAIAHLAKDSQFRDSKLSVGPQGTVLDSTKFSSLPRLFDYLNEFRQEVLVRYPKALAIGEVGGGASPKEALKYASFNKGPLNMVFNFDTCWENGAFGSENKLDHEINTNVINLKNLFLKWYESNHQDTWLPVYWLNHDHPRVVSQYGSTKYRKESAKMLLMTLLFMYGTPFLYYGEEIGMSNVDYENLADFKDVSAMNYAKEASNRLNEDEIIRFLRRTSRINARTPMQWSNEPFAGFSITEPDIKVNSNYLFVNVAQQEKDPHSILNFTRKAIALRKKSEVMTAVLEGEFVLEDAQNPDVFAYIHRGDYPLLIVSNFRPYEVEFRLRYAIKKTLLHNYPLMEKTGLILRLRPFESYIFEIDLA
jgi:glycosidase